eukprot:762659-Hanusia_phi.AAC.1
MHSLMVPLICPFHYSPLTLYSISPLLAAPPHDCTRNYSCSSRLLSPVLESSRYHQATTSPPLSLPSLPPYVCVEAASCLSAGQRSGLQALLGLLFELLFEVPSACTMSDCLLTSLILLEVTVKFLISSRRPRPHDSSHQSISHSSPLSDCSTILELSSPRSRPSLSVSSPPPHCGIPGRMVAPLVASDTVTGAPGYSLHYY